MTKEISESDWKRFRELHRVAIERFCQKALSELEQIKSDDTKSFHQRYSEIFTLVQDRNHEMARTFDNPRRSSALFQLAAMRSQNLVSDEEFECFSEETRGLITLLLGDRHP